ncbi:MAG: NAD-dependent epimerase/dehydratase family protein [Kangiellaceae bacterium]|nr:NAD-dependent epimerase/dehydratase family protein [Kangiellaceae bacterium]
MKILVTGANGFVAKNLIVKLKEKKFLIDTFVRGDTIDSLHKKLKESEFIVHLAGVNRPKNTEEFTQGNVDLTQTICNILAKEGLKTPVIYSSSIQAEQANPYGVSKKLAEQALNTLNKTNANPVFNFRLPNVFGKWCKPNYNSAVATFCYNIANDLPVQINDPSSVITLVYIDDVVNEFVRIIECLALNKNVETVEVRPIYQITVGELDAQLRAFKDSKQTSIIEPVGNDLTRALYATFISYYSPSQFSYELKKHEDPRGVFVEMLKTKDSGQFSFFTAHVGITRGGHYHHTKNEKFLVIKGTARFGFRNIITDEFFQLETCGDTPVVVETVPGWSHDITNIGEDEMLVMLWANEIFDPENPDTINHKV